MATPDDSPPPADRAFVHARLIDAPPARVFRALSDPTHLARWWGPAGFTSTFAQFDFRPGGHWRFVLHGPDGTDHPNENVFSVIDEGRRVVIDHPAREHHFVLTITLTPQDGQTLVGWQQVFDTAAHKAQIAALVTPANEQNLDRLAAEVRRMPQDGHP